MFQIVIYDTIVPQANAVYNTVPWSDLWIWTLRVTADRSTRLSGYALAAVVSLSLAGTGGRVHRRGQAAAPSPSPLPSPLSLSPSPRSPLPSPPDRFGQACGTGSR